MAAACRGTTERVAAPPPLGTPGLHLVSGNNASDTVGAAIGAPLVADLHDSAGRALASNPLLFSVRGNDAFVRADAASSGRASVIATTDAAGRARVLLELGPTAGPVTIAVLDGARGWRDSTVVTVLPGHSVNLRLDPHDTALYVGKTLTYRPMLLDRYGNPTPATASLSSSGSVLSVSSSGTVSGAAIGRGTVVGTSGSFVDSAQISVVPTGMLAAFADQYGIAGAPGGVYVFNTDGSNAHWAYRTIITYNSPIQFGLWPALSPDGASVAFIENAKLRLIPAAGGNPVDLVDDVTDQYGPQFSFDGQWIYFTRGSSGHTFWRIKPDGSGLVQVSEGSAMETMPSPSPLDDRVAYQTNAVTNSPIAFTIRTISSTTGTISKLDIPGTSPRWSPLGDRIAFRDTTNQLALMSPDGVALGKLAPGLVVEQGFSWSPAGDWILVVDPNAGFAPILKLVEVGTGRILPLPLRGADGQALFQPSWGGPR